MKILWCQDVSIFLAEIR